MLVKEFISKTKRDHMISTLLQAYKVESVKVKYKSTKHHAWYNVDTGVLELSTRYKEIKPRQIKEFITTMLHEIYHAMDAKKYGWRKFKDMYETEMNMISQGHYPDKSDPYADNKYEIDAREFSEKNISRWQSHFSKKR
jgi:hypothetical protein